MNDNRFVQFFRKFQLFTENALLQVFRFLPVIVETHFADCGDFFMQGILPDQLEIVVRCFQDPVRMNADTAVYKIMLITEFNDRVKDTDIAAAVQYMRYLCAAQRFKPLMPVIVKHRIFIMCVRIKQSHKYISAVNYSGDQTQLYFRTHGKPVKLPLDAEEEKHNDACI